MVFGGFRTGTFLPATPYTPPKSLFPFRPWVSIEIICLGTGLHLLTIIIMYNGNDSISRPIGFHDHNRNDMKLVDPNGDTTFEGPTMQTSEWKFSSERHGEH